MTSIIVCASVLALIVIFIGALQRNALTINPALSYSDPTPTHETTHMTPEDAATIRRLSVSAVLAECVKMLATDDTERTQAIAVLRDICPDNSWPDDLHLADIIEKYVRPYMVEPEPPVRSIVWYGHEAYRNGKWIGNVELRVTDLWVAHGLGLDRKSHLGYYETEAAAKAAVEGAPHD